jgi:hypothetical protein
VRLEARLHQVALAAFREGQRDALGSLLSRCASGSGISALLVEDLQALGVSSYEATVSTPLPTTKAVVASAYYQLTQEDPIGFLGYLYFVCHMPARLRGAAADALARAAVPVTAARFVAAAFETRPERDEQLARRFEELIRRPRDLSLVVSTLHATAGLFANLIRGAIEHVERLDPKAAPASTSAVSAAHANVA